MSSRLYVKKIFLTFFILSFLAVLFSYPCFASEPLTDTKKFYFWNSPHVGSTDNIYSLTRQTVSNFEDDYTNWTYLVSGTVSSSYDSTTRSFVCSILTDELNFVYGTTYEFRLSCRVSSQFPNDTLANMSFLFTDINNNVIDIPSSTYIDSFGTLSCAFPVTANISKIDVVIVGHITTGQGYSRFHCYLSPFYIIPQNTADIGGSFNDSVPTIPDIDISQDISMFDGANNDIISVLTDNWTNISTYVQHYALFFSFLWSQLNVHSPIVTRLIITILSFGSLAMILNIFGYAKSQGSNSSVSHDSGKKGGDKN